MYFIPWSILIWLVSMLFPGSKGTEQQQSNQKASNIFVLSHYLLGGKLSAAIGRG